MTLFMPGSAQLVAGNRTIGRFAIRTWLVVLVVLLITVLIAMVWPTLLLPLVTTPWFLSGLRIALVLVGLGWATLFLDAWRLGDPPSLAQRHRLVMVSLTTVLAAATAGVLLVSSHLVSVHRDFIVSVFGYGTPSAAENGRYNVLLMGGDAGPDRWGVRPDSLTVASIDAETGRTVLIGLPRNLANVPFPDGSPMDEEFPDGFDCEGCYLNSVYTYALENPELFPDARDPGAEATMSAAEEITGLNINYYVLIDLSGFEELVDAVGGVRINVTERVPIGGIGSPISGYIEPGDRVLNGFETLWFARSRAGSNDYDRMARQKCVMTAMLAQLDPATVVTRFGDIAAAGEQVVATDIPDEDLDTFIELALGARSVPVVSTALVPPEVNTSDPDYEEIEQIVASAIDTAETADEGGGTDEAAAQPAPVEAEGEGGAAAPDEQPGSSADAGAERPPGAANDTENLGVTCGS